MSKTISMLALKFLGPRLRLLLAVAPLALQPANTEAANINVLTSKSGVSVRVNDRSGNYQITSANPKWTFAGNLGTPLNNSRISRGHDVVGDYQQVDFDWQAGSTPLSSQIRIYDDKPLALFSQTCGAATEVPPPAFPDFTSLPKKLWIFSYGQHPFAPPDFTNNDTSTPWLLFDNDANAFIISPASHFMVASMTGDGRKEVASGLNPGLRQLPAGFTQQTLVAFGKGINQTWDIWGGALLDLQNSKRPANDADTVLKYLGYWTDNGATYYYNYDASLGYANTLKALAKDCQRQEIPIRYMQLDSWWYYKTTTNPDGSQGKTKKSENLPAGEWNRYGGLLEYKAHSDLFPDGLDSFQKSLGLPLVTHNRWIDPASPYHQHYEISGIAAVDPKWWNDIADYLKTSGIVTYEQDWLDRIYLYSPAFSTNVETGEAFLDNMARACREHGITVQYCMPLPCYFLQGSHYDNLTTIRTSGDRFNLKKWNNFLYTSRLASSMGIWPWADVYMSAETDNILLSTLSAGPVGIGDGIGVENKANILHAARADGVIVKPDASIVPLDSSYLADAKQKPAPLTASTYTDHGGIKTEYVFAYNRPKIQGDKVRFSATELGLKGAVYVYDYFSGTGKLLSADAKFSAPLGDDPGAFYVVAPVGKSGIAFLGDKNKFVGTGKQRITSLQDETGKLTIGVVLAANEKSVTLHGYALAAPKVTVISGLDDAPEYNPASHYFSVVINADTSVPVDSTGGDPIRQMTVVLETQSR
ncbi:MAG TPA: hypothetical protein VGI03_09405 [Verrucomicrobiae bacterium]|jgi:hypothetical protein